MSNLTRQLRGDEGVKPCVYLDSLGYSTIGVGRLVDARKVGSGLRPDEIDYLLQNDINDRTGALTHALPWFTAMDGARQGILLNMAFQLGTDGLLAFHNTLQAVQSGNYDSAAENMGLSKWATQTPERAGRLITQMKTGVWQYAPGS